MTPEQIRQIVREEYQNLHSKGQFTTGPMQVHHHTGVGNDAPRLTFIGLSDTPTSYHGNKGKVATVNSTENALEFDTPVTFTLTVKDGSTTVTPVSTIKFTSGATVTNAGGGEADIAISASPAGSDRQVQFNNSGAFGADTNFKWLASGRGAGGQINIPNGSISGVTGVVYLTTDDVSANHASASQVLVQAGSASGSSGDEVGGNVQVLGGNGTFQGGNISIQGGSPTGGGTTQGSTVTVLAHQGNTVDDIGSVVQIEGSTSSGGAIIYVAAAKNTRRGSIELRPGTDNGGNQAATRHFDYTDFGGTASATGMVGTGATGAIIFIKNSTAAPSSSLTGYGILYVDSGALKYRGPGGTVTTIAAS